MMQPFSILRLCRRLVRPSNLARGLWLLVGALHVWLIARRLAGGDFASLVDWVRMVLCVVAVGYASLKFWDVATILDASPRRAVAFALVLIVGHWMLNPSVFDAATPQGAVVVSVSTVAAVIPLLATALLVLAAALRLRGTRLRVARMPATRPRLVFHETAHLPLALARRAIRLYRRPPPFLV